jgi:beta-glucosidase
MRREQQLMAATTFLLFTFGLSAVSGDEPFMFGMSSASYQYEGNTKVGGKEPSIWDAYCGSQGKCIGNANVADDQFNISRLNDDMIMMLDQLNTTSYRFSIAWTRVMADSSSDNAIENPFGVAHYFNVLKLLLSKSIEPMVTLYHFDLPLAIEKNGGWLNASTADLFADYAEVCFQRYGQLVKYWLTINEPHTTATAGYLYGVAAPGRCSNRSICAEGNSSTEPYVAAHNMLLAHAKAVNRFRSLQAAGLVRSDAVISIPLSADWTEPLDSTAPGDVAAAQRRQQFQVGWFADPLQTGHYPPVMRRRVGDRLPTFTAEESALLLGSWDYFAVNHYTSRYASPAVEGGKGKGNLMKLGEICVSDL